MSFTFVDIEQRKKRVIIFLFLFLSGFYFLGAWLIYMTVRGFFMLKSAYGRISLFSVPASHLWSIFAVSFIAGGLQWYDSAIHGTRKILRRFKADAPDPDDVYHRRLDNIVQEVRVATGGKSIGCVVLPDYAMNAFSLMDFRSQPVIGITEGLLSRLSRPQLEAVIAHEAAHIVSQDTLIKTITFSLFGVYGIALNGLCGSLKGSSRRYSSRGSGGTAVLVLLLITVIWTIHTFSKLLSMFISRQCEYRADATAVRLCRDPLSLAQALHKISRTWRGGGLGYENLAGLFIINPVHSDLDEKESLFSDMFSTHPPVKKRIRTLLDMAHTDYATMKQKADGIKKVRYKEVHVVDVKEPRWYLAEHGDEWAGPFSALEIAGMKEVRHDMFVRKQGTADVNFLYMDPLLVKTVKSCQENPQSTHCCPRCGGVLNTVLYEGAPVERCSLCKGILLEENKVARILTREEQGFSDALIRQAKLISGQKKTADYSRTGLHSEFKCPQCGQIMVRCFYSPAYLIEVDRCYRCGLIWFDTDELEIIQYLVENSRT